MTRADDMRVFTDQGVEVLGVPDPSERSTVGQHWNDIKLFLSSGDLKRLTPYRGQTVGGRRLQANPDEIESWALQGELDFEDLYSE